MSQPFKKYDEAKTDPMEEKMNRLKRAGFLPTNVGMTNGKYSLLFHQIDDLTENELQSLL